MSKLKTYEQIKTEQANIKTLFSSKGSEEILWVFISEGGSLIQFAREFKVSFGDLCSYLRADKDREKRYQQALNDRKEYTVDDVLQKLRAISNLDIRELYDESGKMKPVKDWPEDFAKSVTSIKPGEHGHEVKYADKLKAIELLGKTQAVFTERTLNENTFKLEDLLAASYDPPKIRNVNELQEPENNQSNTGSDRREDEPADPGSAQPAERTELETREYQDTTVAPAPVIMPDPFAD